MEGEAFQLVDYLRLLTESEIEFLIVGGVGARLQGSAVSTQDLDIMVDPDPDNLNRLAMALSLPETEVHVWGTEGFVSMSEIKTELLTTDVPTRFRCRFGVLDVLPELPAVGVYDQVARNARTYDYNGTKLVVADISDIRRSKEEADRVKDMRALDAIRVAEERIAEQGDSFELPPDRLINPESES